MFENCFPDQHRGERAGCGGGKSPSNNASAVEVDDDIEVVVAADGGGQFRDVPSPDLVWSRRTKSWNRCLGIRRNSTTFANRLALSQYSIHRSDRAQVRALRKKCRVRASRSHVKESIAAQSLENARAIQTRDSTWMESPCGIHE